MFVFLIVATALIGGCLIGKFSGNSSSSSGSASLVFAGTKVASVPFGSGRIRVPVAILSKEVADTLKVEAIRANGTRANVLVPKTVREDGAVAVASPLLLPSDTTGLSFNNGKQEISFEEKGHVTTWWADVVGGFMYVQDPTIGGASENSNVSSSSSSVEGAASS